MLQDFSLGLDFLAALCTFLYVVRLLVLGDSDSMSMRIANFGYEAKKRSLLNQHVKARLA